MSGHEMREAMFYERISDGRILCSLCAQRCKIANERRGACGVRLNLEGKLYTLVYDRVLARQIDPIETNSLFHFYPGSFSYSIGTVGCNFRCFQCQTHIVLQQPEGPLPFAAIAPAPAEQPEILCLSLRSLPTRIPGDAVTPEAIVRAARDSGCESITYSAAEPTIFFELAYDVAHLAQAQGLANVFVTNGYITAQALDTIGAYLDAANIALNSLNESVYRRITGAYLQPVLEAIRTAYQRLGIWVEITTPIIPGFNDSDAELRQIAEFIRSVGPEIPWHVTQPCPTYRLLDRGTPPDQTLRRARQIGYEAGLWYIYEGNIPGSGGEDTLCHVCRALLISRYGHHILRRYDRDGRCPRCGAEMPGVGIVEPSPAAIGENRRHARRPADAPAQRIAVALGSDLDSISSSSPGGSLTIPTKLPA